MAELVLHAASAIVGLPFAAGRAQLLAAQPAAIVSVAPFKGQFEAASAIVKTRIGVGLSVAGRYADGDEGRVLWAGLGQWFVAGNHGLAAELVGLLTGKAAVSDQSDGWCLLALIGEGSRDVMARLCPLDVSVEAFPEGSVARTEFAQMMALVTAIPGGFGVMVMRSFVASALRDLRDAMASVAAQAQLDGWG